MAEGYVHGIVIKEGSGEVRAIRSPNQSVVGIVGTAPSSTLSVEIPTVFFKKKDALSAIYPEKATGQRGTLYQALIGVNEKSDSTTIVVRAKSESDADIGAAIDKLLDAESVTGYKPKIILAPGFGNSNPKATPPADTPRILNVKSAIEVKNGG